jgi:hypothetical protein
MFFVFEKNQKSNFEIIVTGVSILIVQSEQETEGEKQSQIHLLFKTSNILVVWEEGRQLWLQINRKKRHRMNHKSGDTMIERILQVKPFKSFILMV